MWSYLLQIVAGVVVGNGIEWGAHRWILHGLGKRRASWWSFHWSDHHRRCRQNEHIDAHYLRAPFERTSNGGLNSQGKELIALLSTGLLIGPIAWVFPLTYMAIVGHAMVYYVLHRRAHLDAEWARRWLPWHYDHHMGRNQDANWCVTWPLFDWIMGTREVYFGTEREVVDRAKRQERAQTATLKEGHAPVA